MTEPWDAAAPEAAPASPSGLRPLPGLDRAALRALAQGRQQPAFRGDQLYEGLYAQRHGDWEAFTNLPKGFRERLGLESSLEALELLESHPSADGSTKQLRQLADHGQKIWHIRLSGGADGEAVHFICRICNLGCRTARRAGCPRT